MSENHITVVGNLTREIELRFTAAGKAVANFGLAVSRRYQVNNEWTEQTSFLSCVAWGELGENAAASLVTGSRVVVTGRLEARDFVKKDGTKGTSVEVIADDLGPSLKFATAALERRPKTGTNIPAPALELPEEPF